MDFEKYIKILDSEPVFQDMKNCCENSPFHREESVFVHTMMVCNEFDKRYSAFNDDYFVGLFACLFHDLGKPACRTPKFNEDRGHYFSYGGHDDVSATMAEEIMVRYGFNEFDIARVSWMIRNHQIFWSVKDNNRKVGIANDLRNPGLGLSFNCYKAFMLADDAGRIQDNRDKNCEEIFNTFEREYLNK